MALPLSHYYGTRPVPIPPSVAEHSRWPELFGIELELEGLPDDLAPPIPGWEHHEDGSLRNGTEYTTIAPYGGKDLMSVLDLFYKANLTFTKGPRTSTHIHINMTNATDDDVRSMFILMYVIEDGIYAAVEEGRKWAGYSVALSEMAPERIRQILSPTGDIAFVNSMSPSRNAERYYGFNTNYRRHGTVEFRYFPGGPTREDLESWIDLVYMVKRTACMFSPTELVNALMEPELIDRFIREHFGSWAERLLYLMSPERMRDRLEELLPFLGEVDPRHNPVKVYSINPLYWELLCRHTLRSSEKAIEFLQRFKEASPVHTAQEWVDYLDRAIGFVEVAERPTSSQRGRHHRFVNADPEADEEHEYDELDYDAEPYAENPFITTATQFSPENMYISTQAELERARNEIDTARLRLHQTAQQNRQNADSPVPARPPEPRVRRPSPLPTGPLWTTLDLEEDF